MKISRQQIVPIVCGTPVRKDTVVPANQCTPQTRGLEPCGVDKSFVLDLHDNGDPGDDTRGETLCVEKKPLARSHMTHSSICTRLTRFADSATSTKSCSIESASRSRTTGVQARIWEASMRVELKAWTYRITVRVVVTRHHVWTSSQRTTRMITVGQCKMMTSTVYTQGRIAPPVSGRRHHVPRSESIALRTFS